MAIQIAPLQTLLFFLVIGGLLIFILYPRENKHKNSHEKFYQEEWSCDQCTKNCEAGNFNLCTLLCQDSCSKQGCHYTCIMSGGDPQHCHGKGTCIRDGQGCPCATFHGCLWECVAHGSGKGGTERVKKCNEICHAEYIGNPGKETSLGDL